MLEFWNTLAVMALVVSGFAEAIDRFWHLDGVASAGRTLALGAILGVIGAYADFGMFADPETCTTNSDLVCGLLIGLYSGVTSAVAWLTGLLRVLWQFLRIRPRE